MLPVGPNILPNIENPVVITHKRILGEIINKLDPPSDSKDTPIWVWANDGRFSAMSCYRIISMRAMEDRITKGIWETNTATRMVMLLWLVNRNRILTRVNLQIIGWNVSCICILCKNNKESIEHMFIKCDYPIKVWVISNNRGGNNKLIHNKLSKLWKDFKYRRKKRDIESGCACTCGKYG